jgi:hypothetical protein
MNISIDSKELVWLVGGRRGNFAQNQKVKYTDVKPFKTIVKM